MPNPVSISTSKAFRSRYPSIQATIEQIEASLNSLDANEVQQIIEGISRALTPMLALQNPYLTHIPQQAAMEMQRVQDEVEVLARSFERRHVLLENSLTAPEVAKLLKTNRQTPHDRVKAGTLLAVMDRGALRFPAWQFDPEGPGGVIAGLPEVIRALDIPPLAKISWIVRPNQAFDGRSPLELLKAGQIDRVVAQAWGVGVA